MYIDQWSWKNSLFLKTQLVESIIQIYQDLRIDIPIHKSVEVQHGKEAE